MNALSRLCSSGIIVSSSSPLIFLLPAPSLPPTQHVELGWINLFGGTMPLQAWMRVCVCVLVCACLWLWLWAQTFPGGKHGCSLLFLLLFQITVCFINAMVIYCLLLLWSLRCARRKKAQRTPIDLSGFRDPRATQPVSTVSIFYECFWSKVVVGEQQPDNMLITKGWKHNGANGGMTGRLDGCITTLFFFMCCVCCCFTLEWLTE